MWLVCRAEVSALRVPPTICLTWPLCRSIQGRKRVIVVSLLRENVLGFWIKIRGHHGRLPQGFRYSGDLHSRFCLL